VGAVDYLFNKKPAQTPSWQQEKKEGGKPNIPGVSYRKRIVSCTIVPLKRRRTGLLINTFNALFLKKIDS